MVSNLLFRELEPERKSESEPSEQCRRKGRCGSLLSGRASEFQGFVG